MAIVCYRRVRPTAPPRKQDANGTASARRLAGGYTDSDARLNPLPASAVPPVSKRFWAIIRDAKCSPSRRSVREFFELRTERESKVAKRARKLIVKGGFRFPRFAVRVRASAPDLSGWRSGVRCRLSACHLARFNSVRTEFRSGPRVRISFDPNPSAADREPRIFFDGRSRKQLTGF